MEKFLKRINEIVFKEKYIIRPTHLVELFDLHIKQAQFLLECFAEEHKNDLLIKYCLTGYQGDLDDEIAARRLILVASDEVEAEKKNFSKLISCRMQSVKEKHNQLDVDYPIEVSVISNRSSLIYRQKRGYCLNEKCDLRKDKLNDLIKRLGPEKLGNKRAINQLSNTIQANESKEQSIVKAIKPEKQQSKSFFANFQASQSPSTKNITKANDDKNSKDSDINKKSEVKKEKIETKNCNDKKEDSPKLENDKSQSKKEKDKKAKLKRVVMEYSSDEELNSENINDAEMKDDDDIDQSDNKKQVKRPSRVFDSDSEDDSTHSKENNNMKHKNKKQRKKVIVESDDEDIETQMEQKPKLGSIESMFKSQTTSTKLSGQVSQDSCTNKTVNEEETYIDEDGFKVHRASNKIDKEKPTEIKSTMLKQEKCTELRPSEIVKKSSTSTTATSSAKSKPVGKANQTSIMSFFKPKNQS